MSFLKGLFQKSFRGFPTEIGINEFSNEFSIRNLNAEFSNEFFKIWNCKRFQKVFLAENVIKEF